MIPPIITFPAITWATGQGQVGGQETLAGRLFEAAGGHDGVIDTALFGVHKNLEQPTGVASIRESTVIRIPSRECAVGTFEVNAAQCQLLEVIHTLGPPRRLAGRLDSWQ